MAAARRGLALEQDAAVGEELMLDGAAVLRWEEHVPWLAKRNGLEFVDVRLSESSLCEFDLSKFKGLLGYEPRHDVASVVETAEAMLRREETGVVRTGAQSGRWERRVDDPNGAPWGGHRQDVAFGRYGHLSQPPLAVAINSSPEHLVD